MAIEEQPTPVNSVVNQFAGAMPPVNPVNSIVNQSAGVMLGLTPNLYYNHPLFLSPSDVSGIQMILLQLTRIENYSMWYRSMRMALLGRNKWWLVDGTCSKEKISENMWNRWERVNAIVLSWLMNSVTNGLLGGIMYASSIQVV